MIDCTILKLANEKRTNGKTPITHYRVRHKSEEISGYHKTDWPLSVFQFQRSVPDPLEHCRRHRLTKAFSTRSFWRLSKTRPRKCVPRALLCILSFVIERPLNGFTAAVPLSLSDFLPVKLVSASWYVPVRHEHKGINIEQIKSQKYRLTIRPLN